MATGYWRMDITFLLNGETVELTGVSPTTTVLDWLRETRGLTGTKEGCNEGDCGACTVMVTDEAGTRALNGCILFLPQINGKTLTTVEGLAAPDGEMHPVQQAMVEHHGSQCGFCTPGFVVSMAVGQINGETDHDLQLAGNLCRCTGYWKIIEAMKEAAMLARREHAAAELTRHMLLTTRKFAHLGREGAIEAVVADWLGAWHLKRDEWPEIAAEMGYDIVHHRLELYGRKRRTG